MVPNLASLALPLLRRIDPERAHGVALAALRTGLAPRPAPADPILATTAFGLDWSTPIGLAAGFDKNGVAFRPLLAAGFGCVEVGTVTPLPQPGNPKPRLFRLPEDGAVINRMGFNGQGADKVAARLRGGHAGRVGVNLGINKHAADPPGDYARLVQRFAPLADYLVINVSSPNTPGLRDFQGERQLHAILAALPLDRPPLLVKLAPDLAHEALGPAVELCVRHGVAGLVIANTTLARPATLRGRHAAQAGGLSGAPLFARSTAMLARAHRLAAGRLGLIGVGGIADGRQALTKIKAGADLVQIYTAFAYGGPACIGRIGQELAAALRAEKFGCVADAVGVDAANLAKLS